jgi:hypothetical protein
MTEKVKGDGVLRELHAKGKQLLDTYDKVRELTNISYAEWRILTEKFIPSHLKEKFTNDNGTGIIDIAQMKKHNLNNNEAFKTYFWMLADNGFCSYIRSENEAVRRGFMVSDGIVRVAEGDYGKE